MPVLFLQMVGNQWCDLKGNVHSDFPLNNPPVLTAQPLIDDVAAALKAEGLDGAACDTRTAAFAVAVRTAFDLL
jgi:hypothetical protein